MSRRVQKKFPGLAGQGLKALSVEGDGNCLFRSLSDQMFGHPDEHLAIREKVVKFMRKNPGDFEVWITEENMRVRNAPKRKLSPKRYTKGPTSGEKSTWERYLVKMATPKAYGGQQEIKAFARAFDMDVRVHTQSQHQHDPYRADDNTGARPRRMAHLAYADQHYWSVRNVAGPHKGPAQTLPKGEESFEQRMEKYCAASHSTASSPLSSLELSDEESSETSVQQPPMLEACGQTTKRKREKEPTPAPRPAPGRNQDPNSAFIDRFDDDFDSEEESKPYHRPAPAPKLASTYEHNSALADLFSDSD
ncbi:uncharacterized protein RAG0_00426 [Rhynchosporium agropyri]|uniref:OTU domain-containing protein n=1 Tax=Rhynchosporium agropyri TaxID=914238 RepID=A0A1E1JSZ3_9HELO|nr:uncharacterized protein RAG0_00426 [Rhynchosporium agropyri]